VTGPIKVTVGKALSKGEEKEIAYGKSATWTFTEDGLYTVTSIVPPKVESVNLSGGNTKTVTIR